MRIVCLRWARSSRSVDNVEKFLSQGVAPWNPARAPRLVTGHPGRTARQRGAILERVVAVLPHGLAAVLARNGREWHTVVGLCGLIRTLIIDQCGIYEPRQPN